MSGSWLMLSAASKEFSTSSLIVVYRHLPGCVLHNASCYKSLLRLRRGTQDTSCVTSHVVEAGDVLVFGKEFCRALVLEGVFACLCHLLPHARPS